MPGIFFFADIALLGIMLKRGSAEAEPAEAEG